MSKRFRRVLLLIAVLLFFIALSPFLWRMTVRYYYAGAMYDVDSVRSEHVAIVYGAEVRGARLTTILRDRMDTAIALYHAGKVNKLLVSGDNSFADYNEPDAMRQYAITQGVAPDDVVADYAGRRTYDTCYRAYHVFQLESAILVTQAFHLPRAIFTCNMLGLDTVGVGSDPRIYRQADYYEGRETLATYRALWDVMRHQPAEIVGAAEPIE